MVGERIRGEVFIVRVLFIRREVCKGGRGELRR